MKKIKTLTSLTILLFFGFQFITAQEKINQLDAQGNRTGLWKKTYTNNRIRYEGQFEAGKEVGVFKYYSALSSDFPIIIKTFKKGTSMAKVQFFTEKGVLESEGEMEGENRVGKWFYYHSDGKTLMIEENYKNGVLEGEYKAYYKNGKMNEFLNYENGLLHGNTKRYADNGVLLDDLNYKEGKLHGLANYYNIEGKLIYTGNYENDEKVGDWEYFQNGKPSNGSNMKQ